jgi:hypothetical protein
MSREFHDLRRLSRALEDFLNRCGAGLRFKVLNFGTGWWTSVHTMLNFVLNVRDFHPDFVVVHENCNDEKYRGYAGMRGDYAHAIRPLSLWRYRDAWLYRFSLLYRLGIVLISKRFPRVYYFPHVGVAMVRGKTPDYVSEELRLFRRNIETICDLAAADGIKVIIPTMPFSKLHRYTPIRSRPISSPSSRRQRDSAGDRDRKRRRVGRTRAVVSR